MKSPLYLLTALLYSPLTASQAAKMPAKVKKLEQAWQPQNDRYTAPALKSTTP